MSETAGLLPRPVETDRSPLRAELDRVGASFAKAGAAGRRSSRLLNREPALAQDLGYTLGCCEIDHKV